MQPTVCTENWLTVDSDQSLHHTIINVSQLDDTDQKIIYIRSHRGWSNRNVNAFYKYRTPTIQYRHVLYYKQIYIIVKTNYAHVSQGPNNAFKIGIFK